MRADALADRPTALAAPDVLLSKAKTGSPNSEIVLPANVYAYQDAPIYARTNGYLSHWYFDIGAHVRKGQLLAVISSPEVDQQLLQARPTWPRGGQRRLRQEQAKPLSGPAGTERCLATGHGKLRDPGQSSNTAGEVAKANVQRLEQLTSFEKIYAPFNGVITSRSIDIGQLIDRAPPKSSSTWRRRCVARLRERTADLLPRRIARGQGAAHLFRISGPQLSRHAGPHGEIHRRQFRTLLVEVDVDNRKGELLPGAYTEVHLKVGRRSPRSSFRYPR